MRAKCERNLMLTFGMNDAIETNVFFSSINASVNAKFNAAAWCEYALTETSGSDMYFMHLLASYCYVQFMCYQIHGKSIKMSPSERHQISFANYLQSYLHRETEY